MKKLYTFLFVIFMLYMVATPFYVAPFNMAQEGRWAYQMREEIHSRNIPLNLKKDTSFVVGDKIIERDYSPAQKYKKDYSKWRITAENGDCAVIYDKWWYVLNWK